ncbi:MAG: hypothetical protein ACO1QB_14440 [Verrucomicrobiales bacterium]
MRLPIPLLSQSNLLNAQVRNLSTDLILSTEEFIEHAHELAPDGLDLFQITRSPGVTSLSRIPSHQRSSVFKHFGVSLHVQLPHAGEVAVVYSPDAQRLQAALQRLNAQLSS